MTGKNNPEEEVREPVLSPVDRVSELLFGLFMALTFVGAVSVRSPGASKSEQCSPLPWAATLPGASSTRSCTWFALSRIAAGCSRSYAPCEPPQTRKRAARSSSARCRAWRRVSSRRWKSRPCAGESSLCPPCRRDRLCEWNDLLAAVAIFLIVVASTFPVVLPFCADPGCRNGEDGIPRHRAGDAVLRRARSWPLRGLRKLEGRVHDDRARHRARARDQRARRMKARPVGHRSRWPPSSLRRHSPARTNTQRAPRFSSHETVVGIRDHRVSDRRSRRRELHVGDRGSRSRPAAPRGQVQLRVDRCALGFRRLDLFRRGSDHMGS